MDAKSSAEQERSRVLVRTLACVLQKLVDVNRKVGFGCVKRTLGTN